MIDKINFDRIVFGQSIETWLAALGLAAGILLAVKLAKAVLRRRFSRMVEQNQKDLYGFLLASVQKVYFLTILVVSVYAGSRLLTLNARLDIWLGSIMVIAVLIQVGFWANEAVTYGTKRYERANGEPDPSRLTTIRAGRFIARLVLVVIVTLLALDNIPGVEITALIASLGIGGIAVALAVQNILSDLFASLSIVLDKPFVVGDFIIVDNYLGSVEHIGLKTTRVRSLSGEQLVFSNNDLLKSRIRNYKRMAERRVVFSLGVVYQTPPEKLEKIPGMIRQVIESLENTRFDRAHFSSYGDFALNFEVVYYVLSADYNQYMDIQQATNLEIFRRFQQDDIDFAYPTRTLYLKGEALPNGETRQSEAPVFAGHN